VDVNRFEGSARVSTTVSGRGGAVLSLFLSDVGRPVLFHHRADDDVEHRVFDVLLDESTESGITESGRVDVGLVLVGFAIQEDLWAKHTRDRECTGRQKQKQIPDIRKSQFQTQLGEGVRNKKKRLGKLEGGGGLLTGSSSRKCDGSG
jgi:hypothetical protein